MAQWAFVEWLLLWLFEFEGFEFDWDRGNAFKSVLKHKVTGREVEEIFRLRTAMPLGIQISPPVKDDEKRYGIVGQTSKGRILMLVFTMRGSKVRVISGRSANRKEKRNYEKFLRKIVEGV